MLRFLLVWAIISCSVEDNRSSDRYRIDVEGLVDGQHVYLGTKLTDISIKVTKFLVDSKYEGGDETRSVSDEGVVTSGSLQVDVDCSGSEVFSGKLTVTSETTKVPELDLALDKFKHGSCKLEAVYDDGETEHPHRDKQLVGFSIIDEGFCSKDDMSSTGYTIGKGFELECANPTVTLTTQCGDDLKLFFFDSGANGATNLSLKLLDNNYAVVVTNEVDDSWSVPTGCNLKINNREMTITKPSAGQNLAQNVEITSINVHGFSGNMALEAEEGANFYLTVGSNWYLQETHQNFLAYPDDLRKLAIMTHKDSWWSYLAGPEISSIDDQPLRAGQPINWGASLPPENCSLYLYSDGTLTDYDGQQIGDNGYLFTSSACTIKTNKLGVMFDVPVADAEFKLQTADETPIYQSTWASNTVSLTLPTQQEVENIMGDNVNEKVWIYRRVNTRTNIGGIGEYGDWQVVNVDGSRWGTMISQLISDSRTIDSCDEANNNVEACLLFASDVYNVMIRVERNDQSYWFDIF